MDLFQRINEFKEGKIKDNSIRAYVISINRIYGSDDYKDLSFLDDRDKVMEKINELSNVTTQMNYLNAVVVSLQSIGKDPKYYIKKRETLRKGYDKTLKKHIKSIKQEDNWMSVEGLKDIVTSLKNEVRRQKLNTKKDELTINEVMLFQDYVIGLLYTELPPVRLDYTPMRVVYDSLPTSMPDTINYLYVKNKSSKQFILNTYKTQKSFGQKIINIGKNAECRKLNRILNRWLEINPTPNFLITKKFAPMSENMLGRNITRIFTKDGKSASLNIIRHIVASEGVDIDKTKSQKALAEGMLHGSETQLLYAKV